MLGGRRTHAPTLPVRFVGENAGVSNPYAPPEDRPRKPDGDQAGAPAQERGPAQQPPPYLPQHPYQQPVLQQQLAPQPVREPVPTDPEGAARASRIARWFALLVLASVLVSMTRLPFSLAASVLGLVAIGVGVWALIVAAQAHVRGTLPVMLAVGLFISLLWSMTASLPLLTLRADLDHQACLDGALTVSAKAACETEYEKARQEQVERLGGGARG